MNIIIKCLDPKSQAAFLIVLATIFIAGTMVLAKSLGQDWLGESLHPLQISAGRFSFAWMALVIVFIVKKPIIKSPNLKLHTIRSLLGWSGVTLMFASASMIPLSDATAISFLNPVFAMLLALFFLKEKIGKYRWIAAFLAITGAFVLLRPSSNTIQIAGLLALFAAIFMGAELILMKIITRNESSFQILIINNSIGFTVSACAAYFVWQDPTNLQWFALISIGLLMICAQACYINAIAIADASYVAPFSYMTLIFVTLYDFILFNQIPDHISLIGIFLILIGAILLAWREKINLEPKN